MQRAALKDLSKSDSDALLYLSHASLSTTSETALMNLVRGLQVLFPFENAVCACGNVACVLSPSRPDLHLLNISYPRDYLEMYFENLYHLTDQVLLQLLCTQRPVNWLEVDTRADHHDPAAALAVDFNMKDGWAHGVVSPGTLDCTAFFWGGPSTENSRRVISILDYITPFLAQAYQRIIRPCPQVSIQLTAREIEILRWIKEGKSSWEISRILSCSKRVVDFHASNIKKKLNAVTRSQAVAIAMEKGLIQF